MLGLEYSRCVPGGFPVLEVVEHGLGAVGGLWELQRQATRCVSGQLQQADMVKSAALEPGKMLAGRVRQLQCAARLCVTAKRGGKGFAQ